MNLSDGLSPLHLFESDFPVRLTLALLHFLWQGCLIAGVIVAAGYCLRRASASARYAVNVGGLLLLAACPPLTYALLEVSASNELRIPAEQSARALEQSVVAHPPASQAVEAGTLSGESLGPVPAPATAGLEGNHQPGASPVSERSPIDRFAPYAALAYLVGVLSMLVRLTIALWGGRRLRLAATPMEQTELLAMVARQAKRIGLKTLPAVAWCQRTSVPVVVGIIKPVVLLPATLATGLNPGQVEALLAHELAHIRRCDLVVNLLQRLIEAALFFHPAVWYVSRRVSHERENACDDLVLSAGWQRIQYAEAMVRMAELCAGLRCATPNQAAALAASGGSPSQFKRRVLRLLDAETGPRLRLTPGGVILFMTLVIASGAMLGLCISNHGQAVAEAAEQPNDLPDAELTPAGIADEIEAAMKQFASVEYRAEYDEVRDVNAFMRDRKPLLVEGSGSYSYRGDGWRWFVDELGFRTSSGKEGTRPMHLIAGFDGQLHFSARDERLELGDDDLSSSRLEPRAAFWHAGRTPEWLLLALRRPEARIDRREEIRGHRRLVVISEWGADKNRWRYEITVAPDQSWLLLRCRVEHAGKPYCDFEISELAQTGDGVWYPVRLSSAQHALPMPYDRKQVHVTSFRLRSDFQVDDFRFAPPVGFDIVDHRRGIAWHNDPWWPELEPWLRENLNWPRPDLLVLRELQSYADERIAGQPAPPIQAAEWLGEEPGPWNRPGRRATVLFFFGGRPIASTPEQIAGIKALQARYRERGIDVVGMATSTETPELTRQAVRELDVAFPVGIDRPSEKGYGVTFNAYGLQAYSGVFVVDSQGLVHLVKPGGVPPGGKISHLESLVREFAAESKQADAGTADASEEEARLSDEDYRRVDAEWKRRAREGEGTASIKGQVLFNAGGRDSFDEPPGRIALFEGVFEVRAVPVLRMLHSNNPHGHSVFNDHERAVELTGDEAGRFEFTGLRKGTYVLTFIAAGFAAQEREVHLVSDDAEISLDLVMRQGDRIEGTIVDSDGQPIIGATVRALHRHFDPAAPERHTTANLPRGPATTDQQGRFRFEWLYAGAYTFEVTAEGFPKTTVELVPAGKQDLEIVLPKPPE